jgi:ectoine hydroxylase-related dioxygenase (phytanoyl-CoA dioxygenase family)
MSESKRSESPSEAETLAHVQQIDEQGYCVLENVIDPALLDEIGARLDRVAEESGVKAADNEFEGRETIRLYNLLAHAGVFTQIPTHPAILPVVEGVLDRGCLVSTVSSIAIGPGETVQPIHSDDQVIGLARPHQAVVCNTMWALTDFTEANGATRIVPKSHKFDRAPDFRSEIESIPATMKRGSVLVWHGSLWHGGGANSTSERRVGVAMNYCAGFIRQQENQQLGVPREVARTFSPRLQRLLGYGVYRALIGHIDKRDPIELLGDKVDLRVVWDDLK